MLESSLLISKPLHIFWGPKSFLFNGAMAAEQVLKLLDSYWFETTVLTKKTPSPFQSTVDDSNLQTQFEVLPQEPKLLRISTLKVRSFSDQNLGCKASFSSDSSSPISVLSPPKLRTILSGKEVREFLMEGAEIHEEAEDIPVKKKVSHSHRRRARKGKTSRSLSELEFKELKGFMDLGFVFSEEDKDSKLVSLIPGLQRLGREDAGEGEEQRNTDETMISRPYLSEAWGVLDQKKVGDPLSDWRVPALDNEIDMKDNLRFWAHTVASIVR